MKGLLLAVCLCGAMPAFAQTAAQAAPNPHVADPAPAYPELRPVLDEFGGEAGLTALMDDFMVLLLADAQMRPFFEYVDQAKVKKHLTEQFCVILGGACSYTGRDMVASHKEFEISHADFNRLVEVLQVAMDGRDVPFSAQNRLLAKLAPMHREVINK